jgi:iron complex outermembrane receptor protein
MNMTKKALLANVIATSLTAGSANALVLEEIVVTAQKREQNLQDVGISVSAFNGNQLKELGVGNTVDITQQIPGLQYQSFTPAFTALNLRGISQNNFQDNLEAPVAVYVDNAYVGSMNAINGQLFDMERVEVLRGPQGTLFGRNATGGLVHYITKDASDEELNGYLEASIGSFDRYTLEGAVGGAISDSARGRLAARWEQADGYVENQVGAKDSHGADGYAIRGSLQFDLSDRLLADLALAYSKDDDVPTGTYVIFAADVDDLGLGFPEQGIPAPAPHKDFSDGGYFDRESTNATLKLTWDVSDNMELVSITNALSLDKFYLEDADGTVSADTGALFEFSTKADYSQWSQELRLSGEGDALRWQLGAYYLSISADLVSNVTGNVLTAPDFNSTDSTTDLDSRNWSLFGQLEYDLTEQLTLIAGYRWSQDDKDIRFQNVSDDLNPDGSDDGIPAILVYELSDGLEYDARGESPVTTLRRGVDTIDYGDYAARLQLDYRPDENVLVFAAYNRGIKGGNWSPNRDVSIDNFKHDEEVLHAWELGTKLDLLDGLARLNATAFYYDYQDYQQFSLLNATPQVVNRDATNQGGEIELFLTPADGWDIIFGASFIDSSVEGAPTAFGIDHTDVELPNAPNYSYNALVRYAWDALGGRIAAQVDGVYNSEQFLEGTNNGLAEEDAHFVGNASLSYTSDSETWKVTGWVKNLTDVEYRLYSLDLGILDAFIGQGAGFGQSVYAQPRTMGITASYSFD